MKTGRPTKYKPEYCQEILTFFDGPRTQERVRAVVTGKNDYEKTEYETVALPLPTFAKFARSIGVNGDTVVEWAKQHPDFSAAYNAAKDLQKEFLIDNCLAGHYPPASFIFTAKNVTDMRDRQEHTGADGGPIEQRVIYLPKRNERMASTSRKADTDPRANT